MALDKITNTGLSTLASGIDASQLTATLTAGTGSRFPADTFNVVIFNSTDFSNPIDAADREIVRCTTRTGDVLTIVRGQEGTTGVAHNTAGKTYSVATPYSQKFRDDLHALIIQNVSTQVFTASGTYTKPSNLIAVRVVAVGGGGGSGGTAAGAGGQGATGGGGAGGYSESVLMASAIAASEPVTVGAAGAAGAEGGAGGNGGASSFGTLVVANGGTGSASPADGAASAGGAGATSGTGQVALAGARGVNANPQLTEGGNGGNSALGGAGTGARVSGTSSVGTAGIANTGGGAGGSADNANGQTIIGSAGGSGIVIIQEFKAG